MGPRTAPPRGHARRNRWSWWSRSKSYQSGRIRSPQSVCRHGWGSGGQSVREPGADGRPEVEDLDLFQTPPVTYGSSATHASTSSRLAKSVSRTEPTMSPASSRIAPPIRTRPRSTKGRPARGAPAGRLASRLRLGVGAVTCDDRVPHPPSSFLEGVRTRSPDRRLGGRRGRIRPEAPSSASQRPTSPRRRGSAAVRRRSRPAAGRWRPTRPTAPPRGAREVVRAQLVPHVRAPTMELADRRVRPPTVRRSEPLALGRGLLHHDAVAAPLVPGVVLGSRRSPAVSDQPRRRSTAKESARDSRSPKRSRNRPRSPRSGSSTSNTADPGRTASRASTCCRSPRGERREPRQPRDRDVRGAELPLRRGLQREVREPPAVRRQVAPLRVDRARSHPPGS